jgi:predicted AAA+ superfamily ATPase
MSIIRDLTQELQKEIPKDEILLVLGARQAGKTTLLHQIMDALKKNGERVYFINLEDPDYLGLLNQSPKNLFKILPIELKKKNFLLIDEVQYLTNPSNFVKYIFDEYKSKIKIIASGSSAFYLDRKFKDSLTGRKRIYYLHTLSFREFLRFKGEEELAKKDFLNLVISEKEKIMLAYQEYLMYGGYPRVVLAGSRDEKEDALRDIAYSYIKKDIYEAGVRQDEIFYKLFKLLASQTGNLVNSSELAFTLAVSKTAIDNYLYVMQKSFYISLVKPFFKNVRKELTKMPKVYFQDLGLRNFFKADFNLYSARADKGSLLENALFRQLLEKQDIDQIRFWRTIQKKEVDFVIGEKKAYEVKSQARNVKIRDYELFLKSYPGIKLNFVSFDCPQKEISGHSVFEVWNIGI